MSYTLRLSIFPFRRLDGELEYLLVRPRPFAEFDWSPIHASIRPEDTLVRAARRIMCDEWGASEPSPWIDLNTFDRQLLGDEEMIDCCVGYGVRALWTPLSPEHDAPHLQWANLPQGFQMLPAEECRRALFRLHLAANGVT